MLIVSAAFNKKPWLIFTSCFFLLTSYDLFVSKLEGLLFENVVLYYNSFSGAINLHLNAAFVLQAFCIKLSVH